ncbi:MAG: hypothetical protein M3162_01290 [Thermoproteota archaeon]|nr:hypothetical protein [Thermoproteota archaeon]
MEEHQRLQNDFINLAVHELRTTSQAILGYMELALLDYDANDKEKNIRYLETITRNAERLTRLAGNILIVALENKIMQINKETFKLDELIDNTIEEFNSRLKKILRYKDTDCL